MIIAMSRISSRFLDMQNYFPSTNAELKSIAPDHLDGLRRGSQRKQFLLQTLTKNCLVTDMKLLYTSTK